MKKFIDDAVVANTQLEQPLKISSERFPIGLSKIFCQPTHSINNSPGNRLVQFSKVLGCRIQKTNAIHTVN